MREVDCAMPGARLGGSMTRTGVSFLRMLGLLGLLTIAFTTLTSSKSVAANYSDNGRVVSSNFNEYGYMPWVKTGRRSAASQGLRKAHSGSSTPKSKPVKVAALSKDSYAGTDYAPKKPKKSVAISGGGSGGGNVNWVASSGCLNSTLKSVIYQIAANYGPVRVNSTCRSRRHNARVGGAGKSWHLKGMAADIRVFANVSGTYAYLRSSSVGGIKHYGGGLFHIDMGPRRSW